MQMEFLNLNCSLKEPCQSDISEIVLISALIKFLNLGTRFYKVLVAAQLNLHCVKHFSITTSAIFDFYFGEMLVR